MDDTTKLLRLKMYVNSVSRICNEKGEISGEEITLRAVYSTEPSHPNAQWSKWTPNANLTMTVSNPNAFGRVLPGQFVFVDLTLTGKDTL